MKKRLLAITLLIVLMLSTVVGCGGGTDPVAEATTSTAGEVEASSTEAPADVDNSQKTAKFTLYTYYAESGKVTIDNTLALMKEIYPNVSFEVEHRTDSDGAVLKTRAAVGEMPDIVECSGLLAETFAQSGDIIALDDVIESTKYFDKWIKGAFDGKKNSDGHYYAIQPNDPNTFLMFYNKKVFADNGLNEPKNYDELMNVVTTLSAKNIVPLGLFAAQTWPGLQMFDLASIAEGQPLGITGLEDGTTKISEQAYVNAANKLYKLVKAGMIGSGAFNTNASQAYELLQTGRAGMFVNGAWAFNDVKEYGDNIGYFKYNPFADAGKEEAVKWNMSGGAPASGGYAISKNCADIEFAKLVLLDFLAQRAKASTINLGAISPMIEKVEPAEPRFESYQQYADSITSFASFTKFEWSISDPEIMTLLETSVEKLMTGTYPPEKFITDVDKEMASILSSK